MSVFRTLCMNHPILLSKECLREHTEMILLVDDTGLNYYAPLSGSVHSSKESVWLLQSGFL